MRLLLLFLLYTLTLNSCNLINPDEKEPAYIAFDQYTLQATATQGTASHNITELWLYVNDNMLGAYDSPSEVPVLDGGSVRVSCYPGIRNNGISTTRIRYPFYTSYDTIITMTALMTHNLTPRFSYRSDITIDYSRNFESGNSFAGSGNNQGIFSLVTDDSKVFEGDKSGFITLGSTQSYFLFKDNNEIQLESGNTIFLELDYSCNNSFVIGCYSTDGGNTQKNPIITLTPTSPVNSINPTWNKIYIDLGALALANPGADFHELYFEGSKYESSNPQIFLDNLKLVRWS